MSQYFWPEGFRINEVVQTLVEKGHRVDVLTGKPNYPEGSIFSGYRAFGCDREDFHGARVSRVPLFPRGRSSKIGLALNYLSFVISGMVCGPVLKSGRDYDVIFVYGLSPILLALPGLFLGWLKKVPVVIWVQDLWPQSLSATGYVQNQFILRMVEKVVRFIYSHADLLLVQSRAFIEPVRRLASGTAIKYYPNSVDDSFGKPAMSADNFDALGLASQFTVMFAGNIGFAQAVDVIVEAATLLKEQQDIHFIVLGNGSRREWMLEQASQRGLVNLHLPGRFPVETMPGFMQRASVLLVTLADREVFAATVPNKVQAYMAARRPIIACMNGEGARLVTEAGAGLAVPAEDGQGLADAVLRIYRLSASERDELAANAQAYYRKHFDHDKLVSKLIEHFEEVRGE